MGMKYKIKSNLVYERISKHKIPTGYLHSLAVMEKSPIYYSVQ